MKTNKYFNKMVLYNRLSPEELKERIESEDFQRKTVSFYRYVIIDNPQEFRDELYITLDELQCYGRIYVANEGINAQMNIPEHNIELFKNYLDSVEYLHNMPLKWAIEEKEHSFLKLIIKVRPKIVADGLNDTVFDVTDVGTHLTPLEFHELSLRDDIFIVDMRNNYESEVGHFKNAIKPDAETFREEIKMVVDELEFAKDKKILLYCTGGVRCEKASAWLKHHGFSDVNQLHGGVIAYAAEVKSQNLESQFIGKNFVFDNRLGERVTDDILSNCHQCGNPSDRHTNCALDSCHDLVIQCEKCAEEYAGCCSSQCYDSFTE